MFMVIYDFTKPDYSSISIQEALNIWRGKLFHFFQILCNHMYPKVIVISIVDLQKTNNFAKFGGYCSKNAPATPLRSLKWSRAWQAHFLSNALQTWQSCLFFVDVQLILLSLLDIYDYIKFEKIEKAFLSIFSELLGVGHLLIW